MSYRVWEPDMDSETEVIVGAGKWASYEAFSVDDAATDLAEEMERSGNFPDHVSSDFDIYVRDLGTQELTVVTIGWEYDPRPYVKTARSATLDEDELKRPSPEMLEQLKPAP